MDKITVVITCAWCGRVLGRKIWKSNSFMDVLAGRGIEPVSHGICDECEENLREEISDLKAAYI